MIKLTKSEKAQARKNKARHEEFIEAYKALCITYKMKIERFSPPDEDVCPVPLDEKGLKRHLAEIKLPFHDSATLVDWHGES